MGHHVIRAVRGPGGAEVRADVHEIGFDDVGVGVAPFGLDESDALGGLQVNDRIGSAWKKLWRAWKTRGGAHDCTFTTK